MYLLPSFLRPCMRLLPTGSGLNIRHEQTATSITLCLAEAERQHTRGVPWPMKAASRFAVAGVRANVARKGSTVGAIAERSRMSTASRRVCVSSASAHARTCHHMHAHVRTLTLCFASRQRYHACSTCHICLPLQFAQS